MLSLSLRSIARRGPSLIRLDAAGENAQRWQVAYYKSQYSVDRLFPEAANDQVASRTSRTSKTGPSKNGDFNGFIPIEQLEISYGRSTEPTAFCLKVQDVKPNVEIRFHVQSAGWIPETVKQKLLQAESDRITKDGFLVMRSDKTRSQMLNQADCLDRIRTMIRERAVKPYSPTQDELELIRQRQNKLRANLLREKKPDSMKRQSQHATSSAQ